jgi:hypothetical protein
MTRTKGTDLQAQFHRLRARRGAKNAIGAVAASILTAAYHMLRNGALYQDLGAAHFLRPPRQNRPNQPPDRQTPEPRLCRPNHTGRGRNKGLFLVRRCGPDNGGAEEHAVAFMVQRFERAGPVAN